MDANTDTGGLVKFAQTHTLVILCWGSRTLWSPGTNWEDLPKDVQKRTDATFDDVSKAWAGGVDDLSRKYGIPDRGFLLSGGSGAAQYAARLALRKPEYFLAVRIHIPSSFDKPTPEANRILWCLTTGELESGYERSLRFYDQCRALGYPMIYKAIPGLGHSGHPQSHSIGERFFEYALAMREEKEAFEADLADNFSSSRKEWEENPNRPWPEAFQHPPYIGDAVNQEMYPAEQIDMVPKGFRVALPTKELAEAWNGKPTK